MRQGRQEFVLAAIGFEQCRLDVFLLGDVSEHEQNFLRATKGQRSSVGQHRPVPNGWKLAFNFYWLKVVLPGDRFFQ